MDSVEKFPWIRFYMNFADKLLPYRHNRAELLNKLNKVFYPLNFHFFDSERGYFSEGIDPFTIFTYFTLSSKAEQRAIIPALMREFAIAGEVLKGCTPLIHPAFHPFLPAKEVKKATHIENLWQVFASALALTSQDTPQNREAFCTAFDQTPQSKQFRWYLTTGLFWIRPYRFLSLDSRTRGFLPQLGLIPFLGKDVVSILQKVAGHTYLGLCDTFRELFSSGGAPWFSFPELSQAALSRSSSSKEPEKTEKPVPASGQPAPVTPSAPQIAQPGSYTKADFLKQTFLEPAAYDALAETLEHKKNLILQGPPGVGKTYIARRLAWALAGAKDAERVRLVQFHQNTSYEDFIMGFRPVENGFKLKEGMFHTLCQQAGKEKNNNYYLIIDEINRGNTSKIFGDMFMLLEKDKRGEEYGIPLLYKPEETFSIPENLFIIGTMNTADRSLAMLDYALRRRFAFYDLEPAFGSAKFAAYAQELKNATFTALVRTVEELNAAIAADPALGDGFRIGHSYFSNFTPETLTPAKLRSLVAHELIPLLREYWFDEPEKAQTWAARLRASLK